MSGKQSTLGPCAKNRILLLLFGLSVYSAMAAQPSMSGADAVNNIDWSAVSVNSPIPALMPSAQSDDPLQAGFASQWVERALGVKVEFPYTQLALEIISKQTDPNDHWAYSMEKELREIVQSKVQKPGHLRVFCNSIGCLCYVERDESFLKDPIVYRELLKQRAKFGFKQTDVDATMHVVPPVPWELTIIRRPTSSGASK